MSTCTGIVSDVGLGKNIETRFVLCYGVREQIAVWGKIQCF